MTCTALNSFYSDFNGRFSILLQTKNKINVICKFLAIIMEKTLAFPAGIAFTYDNGDMSDTWCETKTQVALRVHASAYENPPCDVRTALVISYLSDELVPMEYSRGFHGYICQ